MEEMFSSSILKKPCGCSKSYTGGTKKDVYKRQQLFRDYPVGCGGLQGMQCLFPSAGNAYMPALLYKYPGYFLSDA